MADLGVMALLLGMALSTYSVVGSVVGLKTGMPALVVSARRALYMTMITAFVASGALIAAFVQNEFAIKYVAEHSNSVMDRAFVWVAFYSGNEGSLLYIVLSYGRSAVDRGRLCLGMCRPGVEHLPGRDVLGDALLAVVQVAGAAASGPPGRFSCVLIGRRSRPGACRSGQAGAGLRPCGRR